MRNISYIIFFFFSITFSKESFSQEDCTAYFGVGEIICIAEDASYLWLGLKENGLVRVRKSDYSQTIFSTDNSNLSENNVISLQYYKGELFVSTDKRLLKFSNDEFIVISDTISGKLSENKEGHLVIACFKSHEQNAIYKLYSGVISLAYEISEQNFPLDITDIAITSDSAIWIVQNVFYNVDIYRFKQDSVSLFNNYNTNFTGSNPFGTSIITKGDSVLLSLNDGIYLYNDNKWQLLYQTYGYPTYPWISDGKDTLKKYVTAMEFDADGNLWCGSFSADNSSVLAYLQNDTWVLIQKDDLLYTTVNCIKGSEFDRKIIYVCTNNGLQIIDKECLSNTSTLFETDKPMEVNVYPNPSKTKLKLVLGQNINVSSYKIVDSSGKEIRTAVFDRKTIDIETLQTGQYWLKLQTNKGTVTQPFFKN